MHKKNISNSIAYNYYKKSPNDVTPPTQSIGTVLRIDPLAQVVDVRISDGSLLANVPLLAAHGNAFSQDNTWVNSYRGARVIINSIANTYFVLGVLPPYGSSDIKPTPLIKEGTGSNAPNTYQKLSVTKYDSTSKASDFLDGDKILSSGGGTVVGALRGGIAVLKASSLSQILLFKLKHLIRLVSRNLEIFTDFGTLKIFNNKGKVGLSLKGGSDFKEHTSPNTNKFTIGLELGHIESDDTKVVKFTINNKTGTEKVNISISDTGKITINCSEETKINVEADVELTTSKNMTIASQGELALTGAKGVTISATTSGIQLSAPIGNITSKGIMVKNN